MITDGIGIAGIVTQYSTAIFFSMTAVVFFIYFYRKGLISFDEESKVEMLDD